MFYAAALTTRAKPEKDKNFIRVKYRLIKIEHYDCSALFSPKMSISVE
jgi:hypothetical protein